MFGDVLSFSATPSEELHSFTTLAEAQAYMLTSEFGNIQRMVTSLKIS
jgi:hypothetical protein